MSSGPSFHPTGRRLSMSDILYLAVGLGGFALLAAYARWAATA